jgi:hypothetical protein
MISSRCLPSLSLHRVHEVLFPPSAVEQFERACGFACALQHTGVRPQCAPTVYVHSCVRARMPWVRRPVEGFVDVFRGKVTRDGQVLEAGVEPPVELPDEHPNALAVLVLDADELFTEDDARALRQR